MVSMANAPSGEPSGPLMVVTNYFNPSPDQLPERAATTGSVTIRAKKPITER